MKCEWRVTWRRQGWVQSQRRFFQTEGGAEALVDRLRGHDPRYRHLAPMEFVTHERRIVGEWMPT